MCFRFIVQIVAVKFIATIQTRVKTRVLNRVPEVAVTVPISVTVVTHRRQDQQVSFRAMRKLLTHYLYRCSQTIYEFEWTAFANSIVLFRTDPVDRCGLSTQTTKYSEYSGNKIDLMTWVLQTVRLIELFQGYNWIRICSRHYKGQKKSPLG